eukprot:jgi/Mesvir1/22410/Mv17892-RA.1
MSENDGASAMPSRRRRGDMPISEVPSIILHGLDALKDSKLLGISLGGAVIGLAWFIHWRISVIQEDRLFDDVQNAIGAGFDVSEPPDPIRAKNRGPQGKLLQKMGGGVKRRFLPNSRNLFVNVPKGMLLSQGDEQGHERTTERTSTKSFEEMVEQTSRSANIGYRLPDGNFDSLFRFSKVRADRYQEYNRFEFCLNEVSLYTLQIMEKNPTKLTLVPEVERALPSSWNPEALSDFIGTYGTHVVKAVTVGSSSGITVRGWTKRQQTAEGAEYKAAMFVPGKRQAIGPVAFVEMGRNNMAERMEERMETFQLQRGGDWVIGGPLGNIDAPVTGDELEQLKLRVAMGFNNGKDWKKATQEHPAVNHMSFIPIADLVKDRKKQLLLHRAAAIYIGSKIEISQLPENLRRFSALCSTEAYPVRELDDFWQNQLKQYDHEYLQQAMPPPPGFDPGSSAITTSQASSWTEPPNAPRIAVGVPVTALAHELPRMDGLRSMCVLGDTLFCGSVNEDDRQQPCFKAYTTRTDNEHPNWMGIEEVPLRPPGARHVFFGDNDRAVTALCTSPMASTPLLFCARVNRVFMINEHGQEIGELLKNNNKRILSMAASTNGLSVITADRLGTVTVYDAVKFLDTAPQHKIIHEYKHQNVSKDAAPVVALTSTSYGLTFASLSSDGVLHRRQLGGQAMSKVQMDEKDRLPTSMVMSVNWLAIGYGDGGIAVHKLSSHAQDDLSKLQEIRNPDKSSSVQKLIWDETNNTLFASYSCGAVAAWEKVKNWHHHSLRWHARHNRDLTAALAIKGNLVFVGDNLGNIKVWSVPQPAH